MPKLENETKSMAETVTQIETALVDLKKNIATKDEVLKLIDERVKTDKEFLEKAKTDLPKIQSETEELKATAAQIQSQIKQLKANRFEALKNADGSYSGLLGSLQNAKLFGLAVMAGATANKATLAAKHAMAVKAIEDIGCTKPVWLNEAGHKIMTGSSQSGGSALITTEMIPTLITAFEQYGVFEADALVVPMGASSTLQPKTDSLLDLFCPGEGGTVSAQDPAIAVITHNLKTLCALTAYSMELDEDSAIALGELLAFIITRSYGYGIDRIGFLGDGTATYFGMRGITGALRAVHATIGNIKSLVVGTGNTYSELVIDDFNKVVGTLPDSADDGFAKWYVHRYFYYTVMVSRALAATGSPASEVILGAGQRQKQFLSYPVRFTQVMPRAEANSQICALLANLKTGVQLGRRGILEIAESTDRYFDQALIAVRARRRISINCHGVGDTTNAGPICGLITAAA